MITQYHEWNSSAAKRSDAWISTLIGCMAAGLYFKGVVRVSLVHMMSSIIPSFIVLGYVLNRYLLNGLMSRQRAFARGAIAVPVVASVIFTLAPSLGAARFAGTLVWANLCDAIKIMQAKVWNGDAAGRDARCYAEHELPRARCFTVPEFETVRYVVSHSRSDQPIFVANGINDKTFANDMMLYFIADRQPATKLAQFDPGLQNSAAIQAEMVGELERTQPPLVILDAEWDNKNEPSGSSRHSGVTLLDDYIHKNYRVVANFGTYTVLQR
jgi:hypothetical protein